MRTVHNPQEKKKNQITRRNAILWSITIKSATIWGTGLRQEILLGSQGLCRSFSPPIDTTE